MATKRYIISQVDVNKATTSIDLMKGQSLVFKPKNKVPNKGIKVKRVFMIDPKFTEVIVKKKMDRQLDKFLEYIVTVSDDEDDGDRAYLVMDEIEKYRRFLMAKYQTYLSPKYFSKALKKLDALVLELQSKIDYYELKNETPRKSR